MSIGDTVIDVLDKGAEVKIIQRDPRDYYRRWMVEKPNGFRYSASELDLISK